MIDKPTLRMTCNNKADTEEEERVVEAGEMSVLEGGLVASKLSVLVAIYSLVTIGLPVMRWVYPVSWKNCVS